MRNTLRWHENSFDCAQDDYRWDDGLIPPNRSVEMRQHRFKHRSIVIIYAGS